jgi:hypothetical protein
MLDLPELRLGALREGDEEMNITEHLLMCIAEESGEIAQIAGKAGRFGLADHHPKTDNVPNVDLLVAEINDLLAVAEMLGLEGIGDRSAIDRKKARVLTFMHYARERGALL